MFEESEMVFHFRLKRSDDPKLYDAILARPKGQRSGFIRSLLIRSTNPKAGDIGIQGLLETMAQRGEHQTELLVELRALLKRFFNSFPAPTGQVEKEIKGKESRVDSQMSQNMIEMYKTLNAE